MPRRRHWPSGEFSRADIRGKAATHPSHQALPKSRRDRAGQAARPMTRLILFNKPYGVLCQFTDGGAGPARPTLSDFIDMPGVYPAGRLDLDSEGLVLLTDDGKLPARIAGPRLKMPKQ